MQAMTRGFVFLPHVVQSSACLYSNLLFFLDQFAGPAGIAVCYFMTTEQRETRQWPASPAASQITQALMPFTEFPGLNHLLDSHLVAFTCQRVRSMLSGQLCDIFPAFACPNVTFHFP